MPLSQQTSALFLQQPASLHPGAPRTPSSVTVHPAALFSILDHFLRRKESQERVIGTLLGVRTENAVEVRSAFAVLHSETVEQVAVDMDYHRTLYELHLKVNPKEVIVGWYSTGSNLNTYSALIHNFYSQETAPYPAVHIAMDTGVQEGEQVGVKAYLSSPVGVSPKPENAVFVPIPCELRFHSAEQSGLDLLTKAAASPTPVGLDTDLATLEASLRQVSDMVERVLAYVRSVIAGEVEGDVTVGRYLIDALNVSTAGIEKGKLEELFNSHLQDTLMVSYISNLVRAQNYDWGKDSKTSLVAKLAPAACGPNYTVKEGKKYAEVWMGTHPNGPSFLYEQPQKTLASLLSSDPEKFIGPRILSKFSQTSGQSASEKSPEIPFLFKILSIAKALPLQAHPDKSLATQLHAKDQGSFVDANHKPEIAVALGDFTAFVGFKQLEQIKKCFEETPELREAVGEPVRIHDANSVKKIISSVLSRSPEDIKPLIIKLLDRTENLQDTQTRLIRELYMEYQDDPGVLVAPLLMNFVSLKKGQALHINADEVHAYLSGDIIECMATSDNVVNAAFVPPNERDVNTFTKMLSYDGKKTANTYSLPSQQYKGSQLGRTIAYNPPIEEFQVLATRIDENHRQEILNPINGPSIGMVLEGEVVISASSKRDGKQSDAVGKGAVVFIPPEHEIEVMITKGPEVEVYWAICT